MAARLPVLATVAASARDLFTDLRGTLRVFWLMAALLIVLIEFPMLFLSDYVATNVLPALKQEQAIGEAIKQDPGQLPTAEKTPEDIPGLPKSVLARNPSTVWVVFLGLGFNTVQMILLFRFMAGWYRQLLLGENKGKTIGLRLGPVEWQLMWTSVKVAVAFLPMFLGMFILIVASHPTGDPNAPAAFNIWSYVAAITVVTLYVQGRLSLAYPITCMDGIEAPVRQSWNLTRGQGWRIALGNVLVVVPLVVGIGLLFLGVSWVLDFFFPLTVADMHGPLAMGLRLLLKVLSVFCMLFLIGGLSAYHAHCYAYLVRSFMPAPTIPSSEI